MNNYDVKIYDNGIELNSNNKTRFYYYKPNDWLTDCVIFLYKQLDFTTRQYEVLQKKYVEVLRLAKENADSYEYCLNNKGITTPDVVLGAGNRS